MWNTGRSPWLVGPAPTTAVPAPSPNEAISSSRHARPGRLAPGTRGEGRPRRRPRARARQDCSRRGSWQRGARRSHQSSCAGGACGGLGARLEGCRRPGNGPWNW
ncbi:hypothetical protein PR202_ga22278 [Eleusine coracana subsp. coracana]|uniref:Uncharacterized protein n=1 Tax=Eleusine coracana subsp. coracana TaxID=191504 RepID=A0AAV5D183_ELECO|nr:hypothetical protein PR202_ga22278 [Eleusine coracana subsp. coracana]